MVISWCSFRMHVKRLTRSLASAVCFGVLLSLLYFCGIQMYCSKPHKGLNRMLLNGTKEDRMLIFWRILFLKPQTFSSPSHLSLNHQGRWGTTDDFTTSFLHFFLFSTAFWDLANPRPIHSLMLSSRLFFCLPCLLPPFTVPCKVVSARPDEWET